MPVNPALYPPGWRAFSDLIRFARAGGRCECTGQCGLHRGNPNLRRCVERHHAPAVFARGTVRLTVAHLCSCDPICMEASHVIAACQRCHLRIDRFRHARRRLATQKAKRQALAPPPCLPSADPLPPHADNQSDTHQKFATVKK